MYDSFVYKIEMSALNVDSMMLYIYPQKLAYLNMKNEQIKMDLINDIDRIELFHTSLKIKTRL